MSTAKCIGCCLVTALLCLASGCAELIRDKGPERQQQIQAPATPPLRFELHEIRNGTYIGTAMIDKRTGRIWTLGSDMKSGHVTNVSFREVDVYPRPDTR